MRAVVLTLCLALAGCSVLGARYQNHPVVGCSRFPGRADLVIGAVSAGMAVWFGAVGCEGHCELQGGVERAGIGVFSVFALVQAVQGLYGLAVADRCEAERARGRQGRVW